MRSLSMSALAWGCLSSLAAAAPQSALQSCGSTEEAAATLQDICSAAYIQPALPDGVLQGITINASSVSAQLVSNFSASSIFYPSGTFDYCNVTFAYSHNGLYNDIVHVSYWLPAPSNFSNRYVSTGGGGYAINTGPSMLPTGIMVGAVSGVTDGGFGSFGTTWDQVVLLANGTLNWEAVYMMGYQAHHELVVLGKQLTRNLYNVSDDETVYSYYQGCSEGGREGWSQVQRYTDFDGVAAGAPAFRYGQQQVNHLYENLVVLNYSHYPSACELNTIVDLMIASCDPLDGRTDGVISRSDLCLAAFDASSTIGTPYNCPSSYNTGANGALQVGWVPDTNGTISAETAEVVTAFLQGLHDSQGRRAYLSYQPGAGFGDAQVEYDNATQSYQMVPSSLGGEWVGKFLMLRDEETLPNLDNVTVDTLVEWMAWGMDRYYDSLQTTQPDLSKFRDAGSKVIHFHGEQDSSIPTASSVHYWDSVRRIMYPGMGYNESAAAVDDFYRLFLIPGAAHCSLNDMQPNGTWPQTTLQTLISWVEDGVAPDTLSSTGSINTLCRYPLRPLWTNNGTDFECVYSQESIDSFTYTFDAFLTPIF